MNGSSKLIILRGHSGSGKSTTAKILQERSSRPLIIVEQDLYRVDILRSIPDNTVVNEMTRQMVRDNSLMILEHGYDVVIEGILYFPKSKPIFDELILKHPTNNYMFRFDVSFDETLRRHRTREKSADFGEPEMREWYKEQEPSGYDFERVIPESFTLEEAVEFIQKTVGLDKSAPD